MNYIPINDLHVYQAAMDIGEEVWNMVDAWPSFQKEVMGVQICKAADSIAANISEGHGRFHYRGNRNFCFYARGSLLETKTWLQKTLNRNMTDQATFDRILALLGRCHQMLNKYIKSIGTQAAHEVREPSAPPYGQQGFLHEPPPHEFPTEL